MMPVGANGDSAPDCAPLPTMMAIRNGGMAARVPTAMAIGASIAAVATLPGPSEAMRPARTKNMTGTSPVLPRQTRTAAWATRSSVPFSCACVKISVTPARVRNSCTGKPLSDFVQRHAADIHADDPRQRQAEHADVELTEAADDHRDRQRGE